MRTALPAALLTALLALPAVALPTACSPATSQTGSGDAAEALRGLPPRTDPPVALDDEDDYERARQRFLALPVEAAERPTQRTALWKAAHVRIEAELARGSVDGAYRIFEKVLELWEPAELRQAPPAGLEALADTAQVLYDRFESSGRGAEAVAPLAVLVAAHPDRTADYEARWKEIEAYLDEMAVADAKSELARHARPIGALEEVALRFPSPWIGQTLLDLHLARQKALTAGPGVVGALPPEANAGPPVLQPVVNLVRVLALLDRLDEAPKILDTLAGQVGDEPKLRETVRGVIGPEGSADSFVDLAFAFAPNDDSENARILLIPARRICATAARRFPQAMKPSICLGLLSARLDELPRGIVALERARELAPDNRDVAALLARFYTARLSETILSERLDAARGYLASLEKFYADAAKRWPKEPLEPSLERAYVTMGRGLYALGEIALAQEYLAKATVGGKPSPDALEQLGTIELKRGQFAKAAQQFEAAAKLPRETPMEQQLDRARLHRLAGEAYEGAGQKAQAEKAWKGALDELEQLLFTPLNDFVRVQVLTERARVEHHLGKQPESRQSFEQALDGGPQEPTLYSDAVSFLLTHGQQRAALDAYHRALGGPQVSEYVKVYTSLWVVQFARARGEEPDPLALTYLRDRAGTRWYHELARYVSGQQTYDVLLTKADTRGKRAEAYFYAALTRLGEKDKAGAQKLLDWVLATDMLGFFEYDMATSLLRDGITR